MFVFYVKIVQEVEKCIEGIEFPADGLVMKFKNAIDSKNKLLLEAQIKLTQYLGILINFKYLK